MAAFSVNQNRQLYVANTTSAAGTTPTAVGEVSYNKADNVSKGTLYFTYKGVTEDVMRSDLIDTSKIVSMSLTSASALAKHKKSVWVELDKDINGGNPIIGQDYILRIAIRQYAGNSDSDIYLKYGAVHVTSKTSTPAKFYAELALSIAKNFSREYTKLLSVHLITGDAHQAQSEEVKPLDTLDTLTGNYTGVMLEEVEQPWHLGTMKRVPVYFDVYPTTVVYNGDEVVWGVSEEYEKSKEATLGNGKDIADLEWFCMGERGDQYRGVGYPNNIVTQYLVDPTKEYDVLDIHYFFSDEGVHTQRSEKLITIVSPKDNATAFSEWATTLATNAKVELIKKS